MSWKQIKSIAQYKNAKNAIENAKYANKNIC